MKARQISPQSMPPTLEVTVPVPEPDVAMESAYVSATNIADTYESSVRVT